MVRLWASGSLASREGGDRHRSGQQRSASEPVPVLPAPAIRAKSRGRMESLAIAKGKHYNAGKAEL